MEKRSGVDEVPDQVGTLILDKSGKIQHSSGELKDDKQTAKLVLRMLQDCNSVSSAHKDRSSFSRLTISGGKYVYAATISDNKIHIVKRSIKS